jgi:hypothetical protein
MTTRTIAESLLFDEAPVFNTGVTIKPTRRRVKPIYCPRCSGWVEVHLQPVRLRCTGCGLEARP